MEFFTRQWVEDLARKWNRDAEMTGPLAQIGFTAIVAFGYPNRDNPSVLLEVKNGKVTRAGLFNKVAQSPAMTRRPDRCAHRLTEFRSASP